MSLDKALQETVKSVPEAVAAGFVDINSGMLLGVKTVDSHPNEIMDILAAATGDLFQGPNVTTIENMFKKIRGTKEEVAKHYFQEVIVNSDNLIHVFIRSKTNQDLVLCVVCRISVNMGMALTKSRQAMVLCEAEA